MKSFLSIKSVCLFFFVALTALTNTTKAQTTWTIRTPAADNQWYSVTYGNGLFVAVANAGVTGINRVMTSPDGINWTIRTSAADNAWNSVTYGNGLFVAVAYSGTGNRVMTSPDGIDWTIRSSAADNSWFSVTYGNGLFVAVANSGTGNRVMTSPDGINWTIRTSAADNFWNSVTYGNGLFVAVANSGTGNRVMTSPDGITWTIRTSAADNNWFSVTYGNGLFVAVAGSGTGNRVMTSPDGITWTIRTSAADNIWRSVTYANGLFVAVANGGTNRVMTSPDATLPVELVSFSGKNTDGGNLLTWTTANEINNKGFQVERRLGNSQQATGDSWETLGFKTANNKSSTYQFLDVTPSSGAGGAYYRLRQMDNDGTETLSKVISIQRKTTKGTLAVYPNPVSNVLTIENTEGSDFQIINLLAVTVCHKVAIS